MIIFDKPYITSTDSFSQLRCKVSIDGKADEIWFEVDNEYRQFLCDERSDAYLIAALNFAMRNGHDITCTAPVTESLLFNIRTILIPALLEVNPEFHSPHIFAPTSAEKLPNAGAVGTGISCGVDSLHAIAAHSDQEYQSLNITHLAFNNVGSHGEGADAQRLFKSRIERPRKFAERYGYKLVVSNSNLMDVIRQNHFKSHTYSSMFPVFCLQKLYSTYFYASSGYRFNEFSLADMRGRSCGSYELLSLQAFSTPQLRIYSEGMGKTRLDKIKDILDYEPSHNFLHVCLTDDNNCGACEKCVRTLLGIDALGALDSYSAVFDINRYRSNQKWYLQQLQNLKKAGKHDYLEMYPHFKNQITAPMKIKALGYVTKGRIADMLRKHPTLFTFAKKISSRLSDGNRP